MEQVSIGSINPKPQVTEIRSSQIGAAGKSSTGFGEILKDAISTVNDLQQQSDQQIQKYMAGETQDLHTTVIAMQEADLSFQMMMQVRNKIVQAYQEIMRMQM
jgi:flagellar hook-basal body complex protein FliE